MNPVYAWLKAEDRHRAAEKSALAQRKRDNKLGPDDPRPQHNRASRRHLRRSVHINAAQEAAHG